MTPQRIYVSGFLCYREPAEACFDGQSLWMLAGPNGSGKSSLFDAITFALYGFHRGGIQNATALINTRCDGFVVEFDFLLDGQLYRARRTYHRQARSTRAILRWRPSSAQGGGQATEGQWQEVADTSSQAGFDRWVRENVGLTESTFRASMMLRQGEADRLLTLKPAERLRFLGEIVGLEQYERLHKQAEENFKQARTEATHLAQRLAALLEVTPDMLAAAEATQAAADQALHNATARVQELVRLAAQAQVWRGCEDRRQESQRRLQQLATVLRDRDAIQAQADRLAFLDRHLTDLAQYVDTARRLQTAEHNQASAQKQAQALDERRRHLEQAVAEQAAALARAEAEREELHATRQQRSATQHELHVAIPWLETLCRRQKELRQAQQAAAEAEQDLTRLETERQTAAVQEPSPEALNDAEQALSDAQAQLAQAAAWRQTAVENVQRFHQVKDQRSCPYCRQNLPHEHVEQESVRLERQRLEAEQALSAANERTAAARRTLDDLRRRAQQARAALDQIDRQIQDRRRVRESAEQRQRDALQACDEARSRLPATLRERVEADPAYPACADVQQLRNEADSLAAQVAELDRRLVRLGEALQRGRQTLAQHQANLQSLDQQVQQCVRELAARNAEVRLNQEALASYQAALPEPWQGWSHAEAARQFVALQAEQRQLTAANVRQQSETLQAAQQEHDGLLNTLAEIERQIADIPPAARRAPAELEAELNRARQEETACRQQQLDANRHLADLRRHSQERRELAEQFRQADRRRHLWRRLADLLGRQGLQRNLVRTSERQIVEYADAILDRLSNGTLHLELRVPADEATERALDLAAHTDTSPTPIDATFLSGSQRFRVAVALSLAIGQYASHHHRPVRSVIIDEGFGCLDPDNRQTMIQELHNLRAHLDRIILVTHQDDIAQAFPHGYHCHPHDGSTRLIPFHR